MAWGAVDDGLHSHPKWRRASKGARALWATAMSWCMDQMSDGQVPADMLRVLDGTRSEAERLVAVGLWERTEDGYRFHDWIDYQPEAAVVEAMRAASREAKREGAQRGNHTKWHTKRGVVLAGCHWCDSPTDGQEVVSDDRSPVA